MNVAIGRSAPPSAARDGSTTVFLALLLLVPVPLLLEVLHHRDQLRVIEAAQPAISEHFDQLIQTGLVLSKGVSTVVA